MKTDKKIKWQNLSTILILKKWKTWMWNRTIFFWGTGNAVDNITPGIESTYCCIVDFSNDPRKICITSLILADCEQVKPVYSWTRACQESVSSCCLQSLQKNHPAQGQATEAKVGRGERETRYMYMC